MVATTRERYVVQPAADVSDGLDSDTSTVSLCAAVYDVLDAAAVTVSVDAYSDHADQMPDDIQSAQAWLRAKGFARREGDPGVRIIIGRRDDVGWAIARAFAPWSIRVALYDVAGTNLATLEDGGLTITIELDDAGYHRLSSLVLPSYSLVPLSQWSAPVHDHDADSARPTRRLARLRAR